MSKVVALSSDKCITMYYKGESITVKPDNDSFENLKQWVSNNDQKSIIDFIEKMPSTAIKEYLLGDVQIKNNQLLYKGSVIDNTLVTRVIDMFKNNLPIDPLVRFLNKLYQNPSNTAIVELYEFLDYGDLPITEEGDFIAYKRVRKNYNDIYTNTISNKIGNEVSMPRNQVNDDRNITCSYGLHICSQSYLDFYGAYCKDSYRSIIVKVNPRDVVCIPKDYDNTKLRCCAYEVIGELDNSKPDLKENLVFVVNGNTHNGRYRCYISNSNVFSPNVDIPQFVTDNREQLIAEATKPEYKDKHIIVADNKTKKYRSLEDFLEVVKNKQKKKDKKKGKKKSD